MDKYSLFWMLFLLVLCANCKERNATQMLESNASESEYADVALNKLIENAPAAAQTIDPIAYLISLLPLEMHYNYVISHTPLGAQKGSPKFPRIVTALADASLIVSFNGSSEHNGFYRLESILFRKSTGKFEMYSIEFEKTESGFKSLPIHSNPPLCLTCHGDDPKPVWGPYPNWKGFYGSANDVVAPKDKLKGGVRTADVERIVGEYENFKEFRRMAGQSDRYKQLQVFDVKNEYAPFSNVGTNDNRYWRPNLRFGNALAYNMGTRLAFRIGNNQSFKKIAHASAAVLGGCKLDEDIEKLISARYPIRDHKAEYPEMNIPSFVDYILSKMAESDALLYADPFGNAQGLPKPLNDGGYGGRYRSGILNTILAQIKEDALIRKPSKYGLETPPPDLRISPNQVMGSLLPADDEIFNETVCASLIKTAKEKLQ